MSKKQGLIALDIDGTLTDGSRLIPDQVVNYLHGLHDSGWQIALITGRMYSFAKRAIANMNFPYYLGIQNGADILSMPEEKRIDRAYLQDGILDHLDQLYTDLETDYLIYSGYEKGDFCYWRPEKFPEQMHPYLDKLQKLSDAPWQKRNGIDSPFPLIKCVGSYASMHPIEEKLQGYPGIATSLISDPVSDGFYHLILITHELGQKGGALKRIAKLCDIKGPIIAAGDDANDIPMFKEADIAIVMGGAPEHVTAHGTIMAPPSTEMGIISGIEQALLQC
ncbi:MAG: HAD family phosphatase [Chlamydiales bacterium]|nr:HAD family phosphatase [Chlamydiales bacterium]